jgi:molecular chaperone IbpA
MTRELTLRSLDIPTIHRFGIGFDTMIDELMRMNATQSNTNYPPYNIVKETEDRFAIEVAVAGFSEGEVSIELENRVLTIAGNKIHDLDNPKEYLHRGISSRNFVREFTLAEHVEVKNATNENGVLTIQLERIVPEEHKPKKIAINYNK